MSASDNSDDDAVAHSQKKKLFATVVLIHFYVEQKAGKRVKKRSCPIAFVSTCFFHLKPRDQLETTLPRRAC
jgi:hypothetical protein